MCGDHYSIADIAIYPWYGSLVIGHWSLVIGEQYNAPTFLDVKSYRNIVRWAEKFQQRPAVIRSSRVNKVWGDEELQIRERHSCEDFL